MGAQPQAQPHKGLPLVALVEVTRLLCRALSDGSSCPVGRFIVSYRTVHRVLSDGSSCWQDSSSAFIGRFIVLIGRFIDAVPG